MLRATEKDGFLILKIDGDKVMLDDRNIASFKKELSDVVDDKIGAKIVFDVSNVEYLTSMIIGTLMGVNKKLVRSDGTFYLAGCTDAVKQIFKVTKMDKVFKMVSRVDDAISQGGGHRQIRATKPMPGKSTDRLS
ncbi:MAG: STAS domain-containing protein [Planctomycetes bacterium]|nr:STAS domain-containing protein [Planctomycetota bacterium]